MFNSTLVGNARNWFSKLPRRSIDGFEELRRQSAKFTQRKSVPRTLSSLAPGVKQPNRVHTPHIRPSFKEKPPPRTAEKATQTTGHRNSPGDNPMTRVGSHTTGYRGQRCCGNDKYTPLTMTPKEILTTEGANFPRPPPMRTLEEQRVGNGYCEYHRQKGHTTDIECDQLRQQ
ncbi:hypothetical protein Tco_1514994 [Tanacetum coccineum]